MSQLAQTVKVLFLASLAVHITSTIFGFFVPHLGMGLGIILLYTFPPTILLGVVWFVLWLNEKSKSNPHPLLSKMLFTMLAAWVTLTASWFAIFLIAERDYQEAMEDAFVPAVTASLVYWFICLVVYKGTGLTVKRRSTSSE